ncbi:MAG: hypothetical protein ACP5UM_13255, partial [Anaerolineae bacterium]
ESAKKAVRVANEVGDRPLVWKAQSQLQRLEAKRKAVEQLHHELQEKLRTPSRYREAVGTVQVLEEQWRIQGVERPGDWPLAVAFYRDMETAEEALRRRDLNRAWEPLTHWWRRVEEVEGKEKALLQELVQWYEDLRQRRNIPPGQGNK